MVSTRSAAKQTHIEDFTEGDTGLKAKSQKTEGTSKQTETRSTRKRKSPSTHDASAPKRTKQFKAEEKKRFKSEETAAAEGGDQGKPIIINRAPVLHLFAACATQLLYPKLKWSTCLSAGSAVSAICAISKGRSIGTVPDADPSKEVEKKERREADAELDEIQVMRFHLKLKNGKALVSGKPSSDIEHTLEKKFKGRYDEVKKAFDDALAGWKGDHDGLNAEGFSMYETFRPTVAKGQKGWGRAAELSLDHVHSAVSKG